MEFYQLAYFREIARQKHFTRAAARLNISQPALSHQIHNLEAELGTPLLVRGRNQTQLTPAGEVLLQYIVELFAQKEVAKQTVSDAAQLRGGRLIIATISVANAFLISEAISRFRQQFPMVELVLLEKTSEGVTEMVESGQAELGFLQLPLKGSKRLDEIMQEMDKTETELANKRLSNEMIRRQKDIMNRLLEFEKAEREQEQDEQRQAQSAQHQPAKLPPAMEEYLKKRRAEVDLYRTVSPALKPYYKNLVEEYLKGVK